MTRVFGVMGYPISHSLSPVMHNAAFEALGLDAIYAPFEVPPPQLKSVLQGLQVMGVDGLNVTAPLKERLARLLPGTDLDRVAAALGAVNTLAQRDGRLIGYNTDVEGFRRALIEEMRCDIRKKRVLLLGAGGAARAVAWALAQLGPEMLWVANRTAAHANRLARWLRRYTPRLTIEVVPFGRRSTAKALAQADVLVNATSLGLRPGDALPVDPVAIHKRLMVFDLVYPVRPSLWGAGGRAPTTALVRQARRRGAFAIDGLPMLIYQGAESFRLWWQREPPLDVMRRAVARAVGSRVHSP